MRRLYHLLGSPERTEAEALERVEDLAASEVLWAGSGGKGVVVPRGRLGTQLGRSFQAVVLDLHGRISANWIGLAHGFVWDGGALILRLDPQPPESPAPWPHARAMTRFWSRLRRSEYRDEPVERIAARAYVPQGTQEQAEAVDRLVELLTADLYRPVALTADRGRGKSSALGLAIARIRAQRDVQIAVTSADPASTREIFRFATGSEQPVLAGPVRYVDPLELRGAAADLVIVDEAAQLPVPLLRQLAAQHPRIAFSSTVRGYEGTGRGFALRFLAELDVERVTLQEPIRWTRDDALENKVFGLLCLDAEPGPAGSGEGVSHCKLDRDALAADETLLRQVFGLLVQAHYRTTPSDLQRLLDAPNVEVHALLAGNHPVAVSLVAHEGGLPDALIEGMFQGRRPRGHALPETLALHCCHPEAAKLQFVRSVRTVVHPDRRQQGLGARLVQAVESSYDVDAIGTLFGATPELLRWRRSLGYRLVRVGASRGTRTGEPAAVMLKPTSQEAEALIEAARGDLARDLPHQLALLEADGGLWVSDPLRRELFAELPPAAPLASERERAYLAAYLSGACHFEAAIAALRNLALHSPHPLLGARALQGESWTSLARRFGHPTVPACMRAMRAAVRECLD